jgi:hypothetical protein
MKKPLDVGYLIMTGSGTEYDPLWPYAFCADKITAEVYMNDPESRLSADERVSIEEVQVVPVDWQSSASAALKAVKAWEDNPRDSGLRRAAIEALQAVIEYEE